VVPLFGDVVIAPFNYVQKTVNYDPQHWPRCMSAGASQQATILTRMSEYRQQHVELMCELMLLSDQRRNLLKVNKELQFLVYPSNYSYCFTQCSICQKSHGRDGQQGRQQGYGFEAGGNTPPSPPARRSGGAM